MLRFFQRLLGWDSHPASSNPEGIERRRMPRTSAASVLADGPPQTADNPHPAEANEPEEPAEPEEPELSLQSPESSMHKAKEDGRDPYDTGRFNRPNVWSNAGGRKNN